MANNPHVIRIQEVNGGAKVHPPVQRVRAGDVVEFKLDDFDQGFIFFFVADLFGTQMIELPTDPLRVQSAPRGAYPYSPVVTLRAKDVVAEGNSMPVFVME